MKIENLSQGFFQEIRFQNYEKENKRGYMIKRRDWGSGIQPGFAFDITFHSKPIVFQLISIY